MRSEQFCGSESAAWDKWQYMRLILAVTVRSYFSLLLEMHARRRKALWHAMATAEMLTGIRLSKIDYISLSTLSNFQTMCRVNEECEVPSDRGCPSVSNGRILRSHCCNFRSFLRICANEWRVATGFSNHAGFSAAKKELLRRVVRSADWH